jgi:hypothetical protein
MDARKRIVAVAGTGLVMAALMFPPWRQVLQLQGLKQVASPAGRGALWSPPKGDALPASVRHLAGVEVDFSVLALEVALIGCAAVAAWLLLGAGRKALVIAAIVLAAAAMAGTLAVQAHANRQRVRAFTRWRDAYFPPRAAPTPTPTLDEILVKYRTKP